MTVRPMSALDEQFYEVRLVDAVTQTPITSGTVHMRLCAAGTTTALNEHAGCEVPLTHQGGGWWAGTHLPDALGAALAAVPLYGLFDRVAILEGRGARRVARHRKVAVVDDG